MGIKIENILDHTGFDYNLSRDLVKVELKMIIDSISSSHLVPGNYIITGEETYFITDVGHKGKELQICFLNISTIVDQFKSAEETPMIPSLRISEFLEFFDPLPYNVERSVVKRLRKAGCLA